MTGCYIFDHVGYIESLEIKLHPSGLDLGDIENLVDKLKEVLAPKN